jgi:SAM-dependent MidA family methyltransferase
MTQALDSALPTPVNDALAHSARVRARIRAEIEASHGWISFARYMEIALYEPGLGYYVSGTRKFGAGGDFVTAPEISPLFGRTLARQVAQIMRLSEPNILELGAGSGALAAHVLLELERLGASARSYAILEVSAELRERQRATLARRAPQWLDRVRWLDRLPQTFSGVILANEVLDALPVHLVAWREHGIFECGVAWEGERFVWREQPARGELLAAARALQAAHDLPPPYVSEINLAAQALMRSLGGILKQGCLLIFDYGFESQQYYHQQRSSGTLMCHYQQRAHDDPFFLPGLQDITAHVDFSALAQAASDAGLRSAGYASQAQFLIRCGITDLLAQTDVADPAAYLPQAAQVQNLLSPAEMGELFKVLALARDVGEPLLGFAPR